MDEVGRGCPQRAVWVSGWSGGALGQTRPSSFPAFFLTLLRLGQPRSAPTGLQAFSRTWTQVWTCGAPRKYQTIAGPSICQLSHTPSLPMSSFL